ncbi:MAG: glycosyltransferase [Burkholderiales bacterium]|nr:glycosyltransferase [Burkholderiales bacterium]
MPLISFCVTCRNRLWQLEQTLESNLAQLGDRHELVLVDYGSGDGLAEWVWARWRSPIEEGRLRFFEVTGQLPWSSPRAKNLAHRIARGEYLFNLDADNRITASDVLMLVEAARGGYSVHQFSGDWRDGTFGRIGVPRQVFLDLGGYDEAMLPMATHDGDLLQRLLASGQRVKRLPAPRVRAVGNSIEQKMAEAGPAQADAAVAYKHMVRVNMELARLRMAREGPRRSGGYASFNGRLNGVAVTIDGFNVIRPLEAGPS